MSDGIKISIIVPVYNTEKFLRKCLDSAVGQTLKDIEIICVNDGSPDNSHIILETYEQTGLIRVINQKNAGLSAARNTGINAANGEYIAFLDSDDWVDADFYGKLYTTAKKYDADIAAGGIKRIRNLKWKYHLKFAQQELLTDIDEKFFKCGIPEKCYVWNKIYRLSKLKEHSLKFEEGIVYEDKVFTPQALYFLDKLVTVPDTYYNYWTNPNSIVKNPSEKKRRDWAYADGKMKEFIREHHINIDHYCLWETKHKFFGITYLKIMEYPRKNVYKICRFITIEVKG
jgi:glycosyltransferase involved in cell wall biosynthesis